MEALPEKADEGAQEVKKQSLLKQVVIKIVSIVAFVILVVIIMGIVFTLKLSSSHPG